MKINKKQIMAIAIAVTSPLLLSCEDVIKVDLNNVAPRLVIEGVISDKPGQSKFEISKAVDFFNPSIFPSVSGAEVVISDNLGNVDTLHESQSGVYTADSLIGVIGRTYIANVTIDSVTYSASSQMEHTIAIDSMQTEYQPGGGIGSEEDEGYKLQVYFSDRPNIDDWARIHIVKNDSLLAGYFLYDDQFSDGNYIEYEGFERVFVEGDTLKVDILSMDEPVYDYFYSLYSVVAGTDGSEPQLAPTNPSSNWSNDALGYFGAFAVSSDTIIAGTER
jgi:hypothetical protein